MLIDKTVKEFLLETASDSPAPGGGSVSALCGALGSALGTMVCNLTIGREKYITVDVEFQKIKSKMLADLQKLTQLIDDDTLAFNEVISAMKLPKDTEDQKKKRSDSIQIGYKKAIDIPLDTARVSLDALGMMEYIISNGNQNAITDGATGALAIQLAITGALLNVKTNLSSIKDQLYIQKIKTEIQNKEKPSNEMDTKNLALIVKITG